MSKKRYTAEEAAELLTADNDPDGNDLEPSSEDDLSSIGEYENQTILSNSDSDDTEASLISTESESEDDNELKHFYTFWLFFGLSRHYHSYIYSVKSLIFIGLLILLISS